jgi:hypothetical protein
MKMLYHYAYAGLESYEIGEPMWLCYSIVSLERKKLKEKRS